MEQDDFTQAGLSRVLILGATGFLGRVLCDRFAQRRTDMEILGLGSQDLDLLAASSPEKLAAMTPPGTLVVVLSGIKRQCGDSLKTFEENMGIAANICRAFELSPPARAVFVSSAAVYGEDTHDMELNESSPVRPGSYYGIAKLSSEMLLERCSKGRFPLLTLRPPLIYGPGDASRGYGPSGFAHAAALGEGIELWGDGSELRSFLFLDDFADLACTLALGPARGVVNLAASPSHTFAQVLDILAAAKPSPKISSRERSREKTDVGFDLARLKSLAPDLCFTELREGVLKTLEAAVREAGR